VLATASLRLAERLRGAPDTRRSGFRAWRGATFELLSRGRPIRRDLTRWTTDGPGPVQTRPWHRARLDPPSAALVRARILRLRERTQRRVEGLGRLTERLRGLGFDCMVEPAGSNGFGALVRHGDASHIARVLRAEGFGAATRELRGLGGQPRAASLEASLIRIRVPTDASGSRDRAADRGTRYPPPDDREDRPTSA
ncbi:MAG: hypothetical protein AB8I08_24505, partial [Sandaracinaceae bacterium]